LDLEAELEAELQRQNEAQAVDLKSKRLSVNKGPTAATAKKTSDDAETKEKAEKAALEAAAAQGKDSALQVDFRNLLKKPTVSAAELSPKGVSTVKSEEAVAAEVKDESGTVQLDFRANLKKKSDAPVEAPKPKEAEPQPEFVAKALKAAEPSAKVEKPVEPVKVSTVKSEEAVGAEVKDESGTVQLDFRATLKKKTDAPAEKPAAARAKPVETKEEGGVTQVDFRSQALKKKAPAPAAKEPEKKEEGASQVDFRAQALKNKVTPPAAARAEPVEDKKESGPEQKDFRNQLKKKDTPAAAAPKEEKKSDEPEQKDFRAVLGKKK